MASQNPFDLLGDDDTEDPSLLVAVQQQKHLVQTKKAQAPAAQLQQSKPPAKLPSKPVPPAQAVREAKGEGSRGGWRGRGYGRGRGGNGSGFIRGLPSSENTFGNREFSSGQASIEEADSGKPNERRGGYGGPRGSFRGPRRGGFSNGEMGDGERARRPFDRRSGTGRGNEIKREGAGRGNWGTQSDELLQAEEVVNEEEKTTNAEKLPSGEEEENTDVTKETPSNGTEEKEPEIKEMTFLEYEKVLEEKRKALQAMKTEERKVNTEVFASMQQLSNKKSNDDVYMKSNSDRDKKREAAEKEERAKKAVSINEFLKPAEGERYYYGGRGRGRGRGGRGSGGGNSMNNVEEAPAIEDQGQFPSLGGK